MERLNTLLTAIFLFSLSFSAFAEPKVDTTPNPFGKNAQEEAPILKKKKPKLISLLTNDMDMPSEEIIAIYRKRWEIELLFKQLKQNFPLRYFYGESANAIKIQIWVTLIANLLLMIIQKRIKRSWSFSGLATMVRIMLMYYVNCYTFLEEYFCLKRNSRCC